MRSRFLRTFHIAALSAAWLWGSQASAQAPSIASLSAPSGAQGSSVTITGMNFGTTQGASTISLSGVTAATSTWTDTEIVAIVPAASSGVFSVTVNGQTVNSPSFEVTPLPSNLPLPLGWLEKDVTPTVQDAVYEVAPSNVPTGGSAVVGSSGQTTWTSATYAGGTFTVTELGVGISGAADGIHFVYQPLSGDGTVVARMTSVPTGAQAGVMIRETLDAASSDAVSFYQPSSAHFYDRATTGSTTSYPGYLNAQSPCWVELVRSGSVFSSYTSTDGVNWTQVGTSQTISMAQNVYVGLFVSSGSNSSLVAAAFDRVSVSSSPSPAPVITSLSATTGSVGSQLVISGSGFGRSQGSSVVALSNMFVTVNSWSATSIIVTIPSGATSGPITVSVAPSMNNSNAIVFEVTTEPLPSSWLNRDIGTVALTGSATYLNGVFTVKGSGQGIAGTADGIHFVYQPLSGDGTIIAQVTSVSSSAQAGVMIRETLNSSATYGATTAGPNYSYFYDRASTGGSATDLGYKSATVPCWVKLARSGSTISSYTSPDGVNWTQVGTSQTVSMAQNVYVGLMVSSVNNSSLATATFANVSVSSTVSPAPVITSLSTTTGAVGSQVTILGSGFGVFEGKSIVTVNGAMLITNSWSPITITATIPAGASSGLMVVSVAPSMNDSNPVMFEVTSQPLPPTWLDQDIGTVALTGSATYLNGVFTVKGSGQGIAGTADGIHFVYQPLSGDGTIIAQVTSVSSSAQAGVMIRETLNSSATYGATTAGPNYSYFYDRASTGGSATDLGYKSATVPCWVKLARSGSTISSYTSPDGVNWTQVGTSQTVSMAQNVYVGLMVSSVNNSSLATATFANVSVSSTASPAPVITSLSTTTGAVGSQAVVFGSGFGASQAGSVVTLNGTAVTVNSWSDTAIIVTIQSGATSGAMVVSVAPSMNDSNPVMFEVTSQPLPPTWLDQDIGLVGLAGSATYANGTFTVNGAGQGITGSTDAVHFVYQPLSRDGTIIAQVTSVSSSAQAGVMIRETLNSSATYGATTAGPNYSYFYDRATTGGSGTDLGYRSATVPCWVELVRSGSTISSYTSPDGVNWTQVGTSQTVNMAQTVYVGLMVSSGSKTSLATATFDNVSVTSGSSSSSAPRITILSPTSGSVGTSVVIAGTNFGSAQGLSSVTFNGTAVTQANWGPNVIVVSVPTGATTGNVVVTVSGVPSNGLNFTVGSNAPTPSISSLSPVSGPVGAIIAISGSGFGSSGTVTFNGTAATTASWSSSIILAKVPAGATSGNVVVTSNSVSSAGIAFAVIPSANLSGISVNSGVSGASVTISGSGFGTYQSTSSGNVVFNGANAPITSWSDGTIIAKVPSGAAPGPGSATVTLGGVASNSFPFTVIPSLAPASGTASSGGYVVITGANFGASQGSGSLSLGGLNPPIVTWNSLAVVAQVPASVPTGTIAVSITTGGITTNSVNYTVSPGVTTISPAAGQVGATVTIIGTSLGNSGSITFNSMPGSIAGWTNTTVTAQVPSGATTGPVVLTTSGIQTNPISFTVLPAPSPLSSIVIQPASASMVVGETRNLLAVDNNGNAVTGATWTVSDSSLASVSTDAPPIITALSAGSVTLTATYQGFTAQSTWMISSTPLAVGTPQWTLPADGLTVQQVVPAIPVPGGTADLFSFERAIDQSGLPSGPALIRAVTIDGSPVWSAQIPPPQSNGAEPFSYTAMADSLGGSVVAVTMPDGDAGLVKIDGATGQQLWAYELAPYKYFANVASHPDGTVLATVTSLGESTNSAPFDLVPYIVGLDGSTGQVKFSILLPLGSFESSELAISGFEPPNFSHTMTIMPDGSATLEFAVLHNNLDLAPCGGDDCWTSTYHNELDMLTIQPDGTSATQILDSYDFSDSNCDSSIGEQCFNYGKTYYPGEIIPDGQGGLLASWGQADWLDSQHYDMTHISGGTVTTYSLPYYIFDDYMVLGDNNLVFAASHETPGIDGPAIFAFDVSSGAIKWTYQQPVDGLALIAASSGGGVVAKSTSNGVDTIIDFDASGNPTTDQLSGAGLTYTYSNLWLDPQQSGPPLTGVIGNVIQWPQSIWPVTGIYSRVPDPTITLNVAEVQGVAYSNVYNSVYTAVAYWAYWARIHLDWDQTIATVPGCDPNNSLCAIGNVYDITEDAAYCTDMEIVRRFLEPSVPASPNCVGPPSASAQGVQLLFNLSVRGGYTQGITSPPPPLNTATIPPPYGNISVLGDQVGWQQVAHELGHTFQLPHLNPLNPFTDPIGNYDLMCGSTTTNPAGGFFEDFTCSSSVSFFLLPGQIVSARKGAQRWVSSQ